MDTITYLLTSYSFLLSAGVALSVLFIGWRWGLSSQQRELIATLKMKNDNLQDDNLQLQKKVEFYKTLAEYKGNKMRYSEMEKAQLLSLATSIVQDNDNTTFEDAETDFIQQRVVGAENSTHTIGSH